MEPYALHWLAGAGVAFALVAAGTPVAVRAAVAAGLFAAAAGFHLLWNAPVLSGAGLGLFGVMVMLLVKGIPALLVGIALVVAAERREAAYYAGLLAGVADHRIATPDEIATLVSPRRRLAARRRARDRLGGAGARAVRRLQRAQAQLAAALSRDPGAEAWRRRRDVLRRRHQLLALALDGADRPAAAHDGPGAGGRGGARRGRRGRGEGGDPAHPERVTASPNA